MRVRSQGAGDGIIQTAVQRVKVFGGELRRQVHRQFRHGLTHVAITVDDTIHTEPQSPQCAPSRGGAVANRRVL